MSEYRNPWKNSYTIRLVAAVDMAFACLLVSIYLQKLLLPLSHGTSYDEGQRLPPSVKLLLLGPIIFNAFQVVMAINLLSAANRRCEPIIAYAKAHTWFQFSSFMLLLLIIKLFIVLWFPPQGTLSRRDVLGGTLIVLESVFKLFGLFIVSEFIDDLKYNLNMFPTPQYYCIYTSPSPVPPNFSPSATTTTVTNLQTGSSLAYSFVNNPNSHQPAAPVYPQTHQSSFPAKTPNSNRNSDVYTV